MLKCLPMSAAILDDLLHFVLAEPEDAAVGAGEQARIEACTDLATLERWLGQAVDAPTIDAALL
jgi:hypothetical protein